MTGTSAGRVNRMLLYGVEPMQYAGWAQSRPPIRPPLPLSFTFCRRHCRGNVASRYPHRYGGAIWRRR